MVKFIDGFKPLEKRNEVIARCSCGCGMIAFCTYKTEVPTPDGQTIKVPVLEVNHYGFSSLHDSKANIAAENMMFVLPNDIATIVGLFCGVINNGYGAVASADGCILGIDRDYTESGEVESVSFSGYGSVKLYKKAKKTNKVKYCSWSVVLDVNDAAKLMKNLEGMLIKSFNLPIQYIPVSNSSSEDTIENK